MTRFEQVEQWVTEWAGDDAVRIRSSIVGLPATLWVRDGVGYALMAIDADGTVMAGAMPATRDEKEYRFDTDRGVFECVDNGDESDVVARVMYCAIAVPS